MKCSTKMKIVGMVVGSIGGLGASAVIGGAAAPIVAAHGVAMKVIMTLGVAGMGGIVSDTVTEWYSKQFEMVGSVFDSVKVLTKKSKLNEEEPEEEEA